MEPKNSIFFMLHSPSIDRSMPNGVKKSVAKIATPLVVTPLRRSAVS